MIVFCVLVITVTHLGGRIHAFPQRLLSFCSLTFIPFEPLLSPQTFKRTELSLKSLAMAFYVLCSRFCTFLQPLLYHLRSFPGVHTFLVASWYISSPCTQHEELFPFSNVSVFLYTFPSLLYHVSSSLHLFFLYFLFFWAGLLVGGGSQSSEEPATDASGVHPSQSP